MTPDGLAIILIVLMSAGMIGLAWLGASYDHHHHHHHQRKRD